MEQVDLLRRMTEALESLGIKYMVGGSMASMAYGEPRMTRDIDIVVDLTEDKVSALCQTFPPPDFYVSVTAAQQAVRNHSQFNVIHISSGNKVDLILVRNNAWGRTQ